MGSRHKTSQIMGLYSICSPLTTPEEWGLKNLDLSSHTYTADWCIPYHYLNTGPYIPGQCVNHLWVLTIVFMSTMNTIQSLSSSCFVFSINCFCLFVCCCWLSERVGSTVYMYEDPYTLHVCKSCPECGVYVLCFM